MKKEASQKNPWPLVWVAALGYFVDVFDLTLFNVVRNSSLKDFGLEGDALMNEGIFLLNTQMAGMLLGGILFGVLGDKKGRLSVLFGSIILYSAANIANAFAWNLEVYALCRFLAGIGLAGELGAGITIVAEILPKSKRGLGTTLVATVGVAGGMFSALVGKNFLWQNSYLIAGFMGLALLLLRYSVSESKIFENLKKQKNIARGDLKLLFASKERVARFFKVLIPGAPIYFTTSILVVFAPEIGFALGLENTFTTADALIYSYVGFILGDLFSGLVSQFLKSRKKVLMSFIVATGLFGFLILNAKGRSLNEIYILYACIGTFAGYWAVFITSSAEQFGTNLRATVATSVPNFVRGMTIPMTLSVKFLKPQIGLIGACSLVLGVILLASLVSVYYQEETFARDLDFVES
jgi:putative MFS transporter